LPRKVIGNGQAASNATLFPLQREGSRACSILLARRPWVECFLSPEEIGRRGLEAEIATTAGGARSHVSGGW
jgi:hypothetical protein